MPPLFKIRPRLPRAGLDWFFSGGVLALLIFGVVQIAAPRELVPLVLIAAVAFLTPPIFMVFFTRDRG